MLHRAHSFLAEATSDSWRMGLFSALATSPLLRGSILRFYATATDHTRRLQVCCAWQPWGGAGRAARPASNGQLHSVLV